MSAYYNEIDPFAAAWLRELIKEKLIADGEVDTRSIVDVRPAYLRGFVQCHFFAGIGGWSYALRLAGWPDERAVWTGSCPCQPFSSAGAQAGGHDPRDLWPAWYQLIKQCRPAVVFGEQVESAIAHGWLDRVCDHMEGEDYAIGAVGLPAASVGAWHIRQRLWFVADCDGSRCGAGRASETGDGRGPTWEQPARLRAAGDVADAASARRERAIRAPEGQARHEARMLLPSAVGATFWSACDWLPCRDGKARPVEPGSFPLAHGVPARVGRLRGYGNAIVPQVAQAFIEAYMSVTDPC